MQKLLLTATVLLVTAGSAHAAIRPGEVARLQTAARAIEGIKDEIAPEYWTRARCVVAIPELKKAAFIIGGEYGRGVMSCRAGDQWSAPVFMQLAKGSWGFQAGAEEADVVMLVMNEEGVQKLLSNKVTLGADASVAAGPVGRRGGVGTDAALTAEILSYSKSRGIFAGIDISGGVLRPDEDANVGVFGPGAAPRTILASREISAPPEAAPFIAALKRVAIPASMAASPSAPAASSPATPRPTAMPVTDDDLRTRVVDIQQTIDRMLADTTPAPVGTSGSTAPDPATSSSVSVDRSRLLQLRQQVDALLASLNRR
jgi:lipid-binding SYLF domain-containing protein